MKNLLESLIDTIYNQKILEEYAILESQEIINESFQSELLTNLAKEIYKVEDQHREYDKKQKESGQYYSTSAKSFASIFGPLRITSRYGDVKDGIQGLKWSEIKDSDFTLYETDNKEFIKLFKSVYAKKQNADFICCAPGTKTPIFFIKGYGKAGDAPQVYTFESDKKWLTGIQELTAKKYTYNSRSLNYNEAINIIDGLDIYALVITDDMIKSYKTMHNDRKESQKGIINYDEESLNKMLKDQQAHYRVLVKEIKAKKLQSDPNILFNEIQETNTKVIELFKKVMNNPQNMDQQFDLARLMDYTSHAYENFYRSAQSKRDFARYRERAKQRAEERGEKWDPANYDKYDYNKERADEAIRDAKEYIQNVQKWIAEIEEKLAA